MFRRRSSAIPISRSRLKEILAETSFPPNRLEFEVTETYLVTHPDQAREAIAAVRSLGISVALDDFGTGYSSIGYLRSIPFDRLKLDRAMILDIVSDRASIAWCWPPSRSPARSISR